MKTKYQTPEIEVFVLCTEDVITTSGSETPVSGLEGINDTYPGGSTKKWGDLWD